MAVQTAQRGVAVKARSKTPSAAKPSRQTEEIRRLALRFSEMLPLGGEVLEVGAASGAIALARASRVEMTALSASGSAIEAARRQAERAGVRIHFRRGNPASMPFPDGSFDFVLCRAPMKSFPDPVGVVREMRRVLRPGRRGVILNLRRDVPRQAVTRYVESLHTSLGGRISAFLNLRLQQRRALTLRQFEALFAQVPFGSARVDGTLIGVEVWFER
jgi:ubiquinone/menaquinone biosynthesis C-methylase UbiE